MRQGEDALARARFEESLAIRRALGDRRGIGYALANLAGLAAARGDYAAARALIQESRSSFRTAGVPPWPPRASRPGGGGRTILDLVGAACDHGDFATAWSFLEEPVVGRASARPEKAAAVLLEGFACLAAAQGQPERALRLAGAASCLGAAPATTTGCRAGAPGRRRTPGG